MIYFYKLKKYHAQFNKQVLVQSVNKVLMPSKQMKNKKKTTLPEPFQNQISKLYKMAKSIPIAHMYMTTHFPGLVQALQ